MVGLKTLQDAPAKPAAAAKPEAPAKPAAAAKPDAEAKVEAEPPAPPATDPVIDALKAERDSAIERADKAEADYLAQSDKLAAANAALAKADDDTKDRLAAADADKATIARLEARIAQLGSTPPAPPADVAIKRPKVGKELKLPEEGKRARGETVRATLDDGELLVLVLADGRGRVQPFPAVVGGRSLFIDAPGAGSALLYAGAIDLDQDSDAVEMRYAALLDADGKVLSSCRLGAVLLGGGGLSARIPGNSLKFEFEG